MKTLRIILQIVGAIVILYVIYQLIMLISAIVASMVYPDPSKDPWEMLLNSWKTILLFSAGALLIRLGKQDEIDRKNAAKIYQGLKEDKRLQY